MWRYFVGGIAALLMAGAGVFMFQGSATPEPVPPAPKAAQSEAAGQGEATVAEVPRADRSREEKRFDRSDKDRNGTVTLAEMQQPRRKAFAKLDTNGNGKLAFEEWTVRLDQVRRGGQGQVGRVTRAEFATTAPKRKAGTGPRCDCRAEVAKALADAADE